MCDRVREELMAGPDWWHRSIPDPVGKRTAHAFDAVVAEPERRIAGVMGHLTTISATTGTAGTIGTREGSSA